MIAEEDYEKACLYAKTVEDVFKGQAMKPQVENVGSVDAWLGSLPGNFHHYCRRIYASTGNLIHMMPLSDIWPGQKRCEHLGGPSLLYTRSDGATPFRLNLHVGDVGHTLVVGPTGAGKSVHLNMMSARKKGQLTDKSQLAFFLARAVKSSINQSLAVLWHIIMCHATFS